MATGRPLGKPLAIGFAPIRPVQHADFDGDGEPDLLALGPGPQNGQHTLSAFAGDTGLRLWVQTVQTVMEPFDPAYDPTVPPGWLLVADLDADGRCEIVVPDSGSIVSAGAYRGVKMLDGGSGQARWVRPMRPDTKANDRIEHIVAAPDLDRDGTRDLVVLSRFDGRQPTTNPNAGPEQPEAIYFDALSGRDGHPLWWRRVEVERERMVALRAPLFWGRGPDGWPLLTVGLTGVRRARLGTFGDLPAVAHVLEGSTGRELHSVKGLYTMSIADFDGDGLADLWGEAGGELVAFRGPMPEAWRAFGQYESAGRHAKPPGDRTNHFADFDGDGIGDAILAGLYPPSSNDPSGSRTLVAARAGMGTRSGRRRSILQSDRVAPHTLMNRALFPCPMAISTGMERVT